MNYSLWKHRIQNRVQNVLIKWIRLKMNKLYKNRCKDKKYNKYN